MTSVITQNIPKVVKGNLKVTTKTLLEKNWLFFPERDLSNINLTRPDIGVNNFKSFIDFQVIGKKHEKYINIEHHKMNSISTLEAMFVNI